MGERLAGQVVVVTGASSGIGRATALEFGRAGAAVVLVARREAALHEAAEDVVAAGGRAMVVATDVRDERQVQHVVDRALTALGDIDVWVNNAGVGHFGTFEETPPEVFEQVVRTTFFGTVYGTRAILPHFRQRGGTLINVASVAGRVPAQLHTAYAAAKHAVMGFTDSLRLDLRDLPQIHICAVLPGAIDTPFWQHAANYTGRVIDPLAPMHAPEAVAAAIVALARRPRREVAVGVPLRSLQVARAVASGRMDAVLAKRIAQLLGDAPQPATPGATLQPMDEGRGIHGDWPRPRRSADARRRGRVPWARVAAYALPVLGLLALAGSGAPRVVRQARQRARLAAVA